ncbi:DUF1707 and DUF4190 domain-containing protein [Streptomyces sp. H51]|uniref:DUF1707 and DUF4190 domain-containing protein n=1 Tax=Streptomyces sp. H51 TaxID=3111770 RepID=UPI003B63EAA8
MPQPWAGQGMPQPWAGQGMPSASSSGMLASHADRERTVDVLRAGFGEGRLEQPEFEKRVARAYASRTVGELALLVADLPHGPMPMTTAPAPLPGTFLPVPPARTNGKAVGAFVCGLLCVPTMGFTGIPAIVLGHTARAEIRRTGEPGDGFALTGVILGWLATGFWALVLVLGMVSAVVSGGG